MELMSGLVLVSDPAVEPLTLPELKWQCSVDFDTDNDQITDLGIGARQFFEESTDQQLITASWKLTLEQFPPGCNGLSVAGESPSIEILLPRSPLQAVTKIEYTDTAGTVQTLATTEYQVDAAREPGRVKPAFGKSWPIVQPGYGSVAITFRAGYGDAAANVPRTIRDAIKLMVAHRYRNREAVTDWAGTPLPLGVTSIMDLYDRRGVR